MKIIVLAIASLDNSDGAIPISRDLGAKGTKCAVRSISHSHLMTGGKVTGRWQLRK